MLADIIGNIKTDPRKFYRFIKSKRCDLLLFQCYMITTTHCMQMLISLIVSTTTFRQFLLLSTKLPNGIS